MAKERVFNYRNTGTQEAPVWEKWYQKTVADAVMMSDADNEDETLVDALAGKVDKVSGKGLSTNDYTTAEKNKLAGLANTVVDSALSSTSTNPVQNKAINTALAGKVPTTRRVNNKALSADISLTAADVAAIPVTQKGAAGGVAELDASGKVPAVQLPSYVDDVIEGYLSGGKMYKEAAHTTEIAGEAGKIYVDLATNKTFRWSGSAFTEISASLALGTSSSTAGRGDWTKTAYDHSQAAHAPANAEQNVQSDWSVTDSASDAYIKNKPTSMPANGGNAATVGGFTVGVNVPANAKFTDTTYSAFKAATASAAGGTGLVPAPAAGKQGQFLRGDGTWAAPANTTYNVATQSANGLMSSADKTKLDGVAANANNYVHPSAHSASMITQDAARRFVSDTEKAKWNAKPEIYFASELPTAAPAGSICFLI